MQVIGKRNYPNYLAQQKDSGITKLLIVEISFIVGTLNSWCVDSSITNHICNTLQGFQKIKKLSDSEVTLHLSSEIIIVAMSVGVVELFFPLNKILVLYDCLFVFSIRRNLISVSALFK